MSENEQLGAGVAKDSINAGTGYLDEATAGLRSVEKFTDADMDAYMNPYIKGALDPAAREIREQSMREQQQLAGMATSQGAWSGSRGVLAQSELNEKTFQSISDLYSEGFGTAFDKGAALWGADQDRTIQVSQEFMRASGIESDLADASMNRLMESGEVQRYVDQSMKDFDYQQFVEKRDWSGKQGAYLTDVIRGLKGSYEEQTVTKEEEKPNIMGQVIGAAVTIAAAYFTGGASLAWQAAATTAASTAANEASK